MPLFRCFIRGNHFPGVLIGEDKPIGFYTTRFVEASSPSEAESLVVDLLRNDESLAITPAQRTKQAKVFVEEVLEVAPNTERIPNKGFTFFPEE
jgi:hypothetical protein